MSDATFLPWMQATFCKPIYPRCRAHARSTGEPCRAKAIPNGRCRNHGGLSTGPKTLEGRSHLTGLQAAYVLRRQGKGSGGPQHREKKTNYPQACASRRRNPLRCEPNLLGKPGPLRFIPCCCPVLAAHNMPMGVFDGESST